MSDFTIYFCADGVLRMRFGDAALLPMSYIQNQRDENDLKFFSKIWDCNTQFEEGLTIGKFLECLSPWSEFWSDLTGTDVEAYIKESRKPTLLKENNDKLDWAGLFFNTEINSDIEFKNLTDEIFDFANKEVALTGNWSINSSYNLAGFKLGEEEQYGIDSCPLNEIVNLPLYLSNKQNIYIFNREVDTFFEGKELLNSEAFGVRVATSRNGYPINYIKGDKYHGLRDIVEGFFYWFSSSPIERENIAQEIQSAISQMDEYVDEAEKNTNEETSNEKEENESKEDKPLKIVVAPNAFNGMIESLNRKDEYWKTMISNSKKAKVIPRIGVVKTGNLPESRVYGIIVEEKDLKTDFKKRN